jgi:hypothetical protein
MVRDGWETVEGEETASALIFFLLLVLPFFLLIAPNKKGVCAVKTPHHGQLSCSWALPGQWPWLAGAEDLCGFLMLLIQRWM